ncbi:hypothetical protein E8E11_009333 [Didymella keratinophila]|nr:hypothetical protein E8E11_009333 [Didymella keratinophila]
MSQSSPPLRVVSVHSLPDDFLLAVAVYVKRAGSMSALEYNTQTVFEKNAVRPNVFNNRHPDYLVNADLLSFVSVCKRWNHTGTPILYRNVFLDRTKFEKDEYEDYYYDSESEQYDGTNDGSNLEQSDGGSDSESEQHDGSAAESNLKQSDGEPV